MGENAAFYWRRAREAAARRAAAAGAEGERERWERRGAEIEKKLTSLQRP